MTEVPNDSPLEEDDKLQQASVATPAPLFSTLLADEPDMADLVQEFVARLPAIIDVIGTVHDNQDWEKLKNKVHDLKSLGGSYGFMPLTEVAKKLEAELRLGAYTSLAPWIGELGTLTQRIRQGMETIQSDAMSKRKMG